MGIIPNNFKHQSKGDESKYNIGIGSYIWMAELVNLEEYQDGHYVHKGRIKLKAFDCWTDMVAGR